MILFSTTLVITIFATSNADAQRCNRWNSCYEQMRSQENSTLQEAVMTINQTLLSKIELLEQKKSNTFIY